MSHIDQSLKNYNLAIFAALIRDDTRVELTFPSGDTRDLSIGEYISIPADLLTGVKTKLLKAGGSLADLGKVKHD